MWISIDYKWLTCLEREGSLFHVLSVCLMKGIVYWSHKIDTIYIVGNIIAQYRNHRRKEDGTYTMMADVPFVYSDLTFSQGEFREKSIFHFWIWILVKEVDRDWVILRIGFKNHFSKCEWHLNSSTLNSFIDWSWTQHMPLCLSVIYGFFRILCSHFHNFLDFFIVSSITLKCWKCRFQAFQECKIANFSGAPPLDPLGGTYSAPNPTAVWQRRSAPSFSVAVNISI